MCVSMAILVGVSMTTVVGMSVVIVRVSFIVRVAVIAALLTKLLKNTVECLLGDCRFH